jgi:hypothetical protein
MRCEVRKCVRKGPYVKSFCPMHYTRLRRHGDVTVRKFSTLSGKTATNYQHGLGHTRQWFIWLHMKQRCTNPNDIGYKNYGGRGITIDPKWMTFSGFWKDMESGYAPNLTLDRTDVNGNYTKSNCQWITKAAQARNKRDNVYIAVNGKKRLLLDVADECGIKYTTLYNRIITYKLPLDIALTRTSMRGRKRKPI